MTVAQPTATAPRHTTILRSDGGHILTLEHVIRVASLEDTMKSLAVKGADEGYCILADKTGDDTRLFPRKLTRRAMSPMYVSILLRPKIAPRKGLLLTALSAVAVCRVLRRLTGEPAGILWPNRIVFRRKLLAFVQIHGALHPTDGTYQYMIISFCAALSSAMEKERLTGTVAQVFSGTSTDLRERVALDLLREVYALYEARDKNQTFLDEYRAMSRYDGAEILLRRPHRIYGTVRGIDENGHLLVVTPAGIPTTATTADGIPCLSVFSMDDVITIIPKHT